MSETNPGKFENIRANLKKFFPTCNDARNDHVVHAKRPCCATDIFGNRT